MTRKRVYHRLKHNLTTQIPTEYVFFDTETKGVPIAEGQEEHSLWFGCARYIRFREDSTNGTRIDLPFTDKEQFWDWLEELSRSHSRIWLFAHNTAYDFRVLKGFSTLAKRGWKMRMAIYDYGKFLVSWRKDTRTLTFSDTMNYFTMSLKALGASIGEDKLSMPTKDDSLGTWIKYCWQDVKVIESVILTLREFLRVEDLGSWGVTAARMSMNAFVHRFMSHKILVHNETGASELELKCYHGGRVEAFHLGKLPWSTIAKVDVNSMYPHVMAVNEYPRALLEFVWGLEPHQLQEYVDRHSVLGYCFVETDEPVYPKYIGDKLCFPIGAFHCYLTHPEIEYALKHGHLVELIEGFVYDKAPLFADFVNYFYTKRQEARAANNPAFVLFYRLILNSLYGKFAQRVPETTIIGEADPEAMSILEVYDVPTGETYREVTIGGSIRREGKRILSFDSFPAISATVTGYARIYLWELVKKAGIENVAYIDTDSLVVAWEVLAKLGPILHKTNLGALKIELVADKATIRGLKDYEIGTEKHTKGVKPSDPEIEPGVFRTQQVPGIKDGLRHGDAEKVVFVDMLKHFSREYHKGMVHSDGRVSPIELNEERNGQSWN